MQMAILYAVIVHYLFLIPVVDSYNGAIDELCDVNLDIPTNCTMCIKCCNATETENISIPTYCGKCPGCNKCKYFWIVVNILFIDHIIVIKDLFYLHNLINTDNSAPRCKSYRRWKGTDGTDLDENNEDRGINLEGYVEKSEMECKTLCASNKKCNSIHYHPFWDKHFPNCNLKTGTFSAPSLITNSGGDWTLYWLSCASGNT